MSIHFVLLAYSTTFDEFVNIGSQPWPPKVTFKEGFDMEPASMSKSRGGIQGRTRVWRVSGGMYIRPL